MRPELKIVIDVAKASSDEQNLLSLANKNTFGDVINILGSDYVLIDACVHTRSEYDGIGGYSFIVNTRQKTLVELTFVRIYK